MESGVDREATQDSTCWWVEDTKIPSQKNWINLSVFFTMAWVMIIGNSAVKIQEKWELRIVLITESSLSFLFEEIEEHLLPAWSNPSGVTLANIKHKRSERSIRHHFPRGHVRLKCWGDNLALYDRCFKKWFARKRRHLLLGHGEKQIRNNGSEQRMRTIFLSFAVPVQGLGNHGNFHSLIHTTMQKSTMCCLNISLRILGNDRGTQ